MIRFLNVLFPIIILCIMGFYAQHMSDEVSMIPYKEHNRYLKSNGSFVQSVTPNSFTVEWKHGESKTFFVKYGVPFKARQLVAFKLYFDGENSILEEFHIWKSRKMWYIRSVASLVPLIVVFVYFFRGYRFSFSKFIFISRAGKDA